jgi:hypothetical protein
MFNLTIFDNEFATEHINETNPFNGTVIVNVLTAIFIFNSPEFRRFW